MMKDELVPSFVPRLTVRCMTTRAIAALTTAGVLSELPSVEPSPSSELAILEGYPRSSANVDSKSFLRKLVPPHMV